MASCCPAWLLLYGREMVSHEVGHQPGCRQHHPVFVDLYPCLPTVGKTLGGLLPQRAQYRCLRAAILRILSLALPIYSGTFVIIAAFQAVGRTRKPSASASSDVGRWMRSYSSSSALWVAASKWSGRPLSRRASAWRWGCCCCAGSGGRGLTLDAWG